MKEVGEAESELSAFNEPPRGRLKVGLPLAAGIPLPLISDLMARYPELELDLEFTHRVADVIQEGKIVLLVQFPAVGVCKFLFIKGLVNACFKEMLPDRRSLLDGAEGDDRQKFHEKDDYPDSGCCKCASFRDSREQHQCYCTLTAGRGMRIACCWIRRSHCVADAAADSYDTFRDTQTRR